MSSKMTRRRWAHKQWHGCLWEKDRRKCNINLGHRTSSMSTNNFHQHLSYSFSLSVLAKFVEIVRRTFTTQSIKLLPNYKNSSLFIKYIYPQELSRLHSHPFLYHTIVPSSETVWTKMKFTYNSWWRITPVKSVPLH